MAPAGPGRVVGEPARSIRCVAASSPTRQSRSDCPLRRRAVAGELKSNGSLLGRVAEAIQIRGPQFG